MSVPASLLNVPIRTFFIANEPPLGFVGRISTLKPIEKILAPVPEPISNSTLFAGVGVIHEVAAGVVPQSVFPLIVVSAIPSALSSFIGTGAQYISKRVSSV